MTSVIPVAYSRARAHAVIRDIELQHLTYQALHTRLRIPILSTNPYLPIIIIPTNHNNGAQTFPPRLPLPNLHIPPRAPHITTPIPSLPDPGSRAPVTSSGGMASACRRGKAAADSDPGARADWLWTAALALYGFPTDEEICI
jgi:hypothetical protein